jgi:hypothetical protein
MSNIVSNDSSCCGFEIGVLSKSATEHCFSSGLKQLRKGQGILFGEEKTNIRSLVKQTNRYNPYCAPTIKTLEPIPIKKSIYAIDSSSEKLGETDDGRIYAAKCGIVVASHNTPLHHYRVGPTIFYLTRNTVREANLDNYLSNIVLSDHELAKRLIRVRTERSIQYELARVVHDSIMLLDGSLNASVLESSPHNLKNIVESCGVNRNLLIAIAKETIVGFDERIISCLKECTSPAYMDLGNINETIGNPFGRPMLVKFGNYCSPVLRADIVDPDEKISLAFGSMLGNDSSGHGYPESLKLAHHISKFNSTEIECLRGHLLRTYKLQAIQEDDNRVKLLGSM